MTNRLLLQIESRTTHVMSKLRQAVDLLLQRPEKPFGTYHIPPTSAEIESQCKHWRFLVPEGAEERAALIRAFVAKHPLSPSRFPQTAEALGVDDPDVKAAYGDPIPTTEIDPEEHHTFDETERELLDTLEWQYLTRGEVLFKQGEHGDALYGLVDGRLRATLVERDGDSIDFELRSGTLLGEEAVLTGAPRAATVIAVRDCDLVYFSREGFQRLVAKYPSAMTRLAVHLIERMQRIAGVAPPVERNVAVAVIPAGEGIEDFGPSLEHVLTKRCSTLRVRPTDLDGIMPAEMAESVEDIVDDYNFVDWLQTLESQNRVLLYEVHPDYPNWSRRVIEHADRILIVGRIDASPDRSQSEHFLDTLPNPELRAPCELVMLHEKRGDGPFVTASWLSKRDVVRHHHVNMDDDRGYERIQRFLLDEAVGFVFGGGGMRGAAHFGAIQALHEAGIYADVSGGTSAGAIVAAQYAMGWTVEEMMQQTKEHLLQRKVVIDLTLPIVAINRAYRLYNVYDTFFGSAYMEDLWTTCFTLSANMSQAKPSINQTGLVKDAVRFSSSIAGIYPPAPDFNGDLHIDGGVFNNTPSDVMRAFVGTGTIVAVDLGFTVRKQVYYDYGEYLSGFRWLWSRLNPFAKPVQAPTIFGILTRSNALASINETERQTNHADLVLRPPVSGYGLFDLDAADDLYKAGYESSVESIAKFLKENAKP